MMITQHGYNIRRFALTITVLGALSVAGCAGHSSESRSSVPEARVVKAQPPVSRTTHAQSSADRAVAVALQQIGVPYRYGGSDRSGFDCSGLVQYSYSQVGVRVPRTTGQQWGATNGVNRSDLRPGDLLFFNIEGKMSHVGLYVGDQKFVHAPSSGRSVTMGSLGSPYYQKAFLRGGRVQ